MPRIQDAVATFVRQLALGGLPANVSQLAESELDQIARQLPLSRELRDWYRDASLSDVEVPWFGNPLAIYNPKELETRQIGYRTDTAGRSQLDRGWSASWLVIADIGADPVIAHTDRDGTPISIAVHGVGSWKPRPFAPDLVTLFQALTVWVEVCLVRHGGVFLDEDSLPLPDVSHELDHELAQLLDAETRAQWPFEAE